MINSSNDRPQSTTSRSIGELIASIRDEVSGVINKQVEIAKSEVGALAKKAAGIAVLAAVLLFFLVSAWVMFLFFAVHVLVAWGVSTWLAYLIVALTLVVVGAIAGGIAFAIFKSLTAPEVTIETTSSAVTAMKGGRRPNSVDYDSAFEELYGKQVSAHAPTSND